jgi:hypothetical protein
MKIYLQRFLFAQVILTFALACSALSPTAQGTCQQGCLTNQNTVLGDHALINTIGSENTAIGFQALFSNTTGNSNTATGWGALTTNLTGNNDTATGTGALQFNLTGTENTATGVDALFANSIGTNNTANGAFALAANIGNDNTATGEEALEANTIGHDNTATGVGALRLNITGSNNIAIGSEAGQNLTTGSNNIDIGNDGVAAEANTIRIGTPGAQTKAFIAGISATGVTGSNVKVNSNGQIGVAPSSERFKEAIQPMDKASDAILALKPVTFRYKHELDPDGVRQFGLVAEDVERVNPDLVARDEQGKPYTVRYEAVNAMLLNEFLKEHRRIEEQGAIITRQRKDFEATTAQQQKQIQALIAMVKQQAAQIQTVSAELELSKFGPQTACLPAGALPEAGKD